MRLRKAGFQSCCGIQIIYNFGGIRGEPLGDGTGTIREIDKALNELLLTGVREPHYPPDYPIPEPYNYGMQLVALNENQHKRLHKMMIRKGFKLVDKGWNLNHKNMNYLYSLHLKEGRKTYDLK